jgi:hypothetical protein
MSYLARLKVEIAEKRAHDELTKPTKAPSVGYVSAQGGCILEIEQPEPRSNLTPLTFENPAGTRYRWRVILADGAPFEVCCLPEMTADEMRGLYECAIVQPMEDAPAVAGAPAASRRRLVW